MDELPPTVTALRTERLILRPLERGDAAFILELVNDPAFITNIRDAGIRTLEAAEDYIVAGPREMYRTRGYGLLGVTLKDGTAIGICGLLKRDSLEDIEIGFAFLPAYRGKGYAFEAASVVMDFGKSRLGLRRIVAIASPTNAASAKLLRRIGLEYIENIHVYEGGESAFFVWEASEASQPR